MRIEIWSDIACPWCFIGKRRFEAALDGFAHRDDVEVEWRSFQLDPGLPEHYSGSEAEYLSRAKGMPPEQVAGMLAHVQEQASAVGLAFDFDSLVVANSFTAHRLLHLAKAHGLMGEAEEALLSGHFESGRDIGSVDVLVEVAEEIGLDPAEARRVLESEELAAEVRADIAEASAIGANSVPFFVIDRTYGIAGAQPSEVFAEALDTAWDESHRLTVVADGASCGPDGCD